MPISMGETLQSTKKKKIERIGFSIYDKSSLKNLANTYVQKYKQNPTLSVNYVKITSMVNLLVDQKANRIEFLFIHIL